MTPPIELPSYLDAPRVIDDRTYGVLRHTGGLWRIEGEPPVVQLAKRLFPGSNGSERGVATFPLTKRLIGDLNWLMQRYPLRIENPKEWEEAIGGAKAHVARTIDIRRQPSSLAPPPGGAFKGELRQFQKEGVAFMAHHRRVLLGDEMGLGKTVQALALTAALPRNEAFPALVVCQPHMIRQWERMIRQFIPSHATIVLQGLKPQPFLEYPITLIHYGLLRGWWADLEERFRLVIFDEIQELRHTGTAKYSAASRLCDSAETVIGLSGTPIHNAGGEIWAVLNIIETHCLGDWHSFTREWCTGYGSMVVEDPELLGARLKDEGLMLRRTKGEVLKELPPKRRVVEEVDADKGTFGKLIEPLAPLLPRLRRSEDQLEQGRMRQEVVNVVRQATGVAKAPYVAEFVDALLTAGEPGVVFAHHHAVVDIIRERLIANGHHVVEMTGRQTATAKDDAIRAFMDESRHCNCAIVSMRTVAGIDGLQKRGRWCVFAELDWSPAVHSQAEDRLHRIGLPDSVLAYYLVWNRGASSDPDLMSRLGFKASQFTGLMGDEPATQEQRQLDLEKATEHMKAIIDRLERHFSRKGAAA